MDTPDLSTAAGAEEAFYHALAHGDYALMDAVWAADDGVGCIHPGWPALRGRTAVLQSFRRMFDAGQRLDLRVERLSTTAFDGGAIHLAHEFIRTDDHDPMAPVVATNVFRRYEKGWRIVWHHASATPRVESEATVVH